MFCPECGTRVDDDAFFCPECGTKLTPIAVESSAPETQPRPEPDMTDCDNSRRSSANPQPQEDKVLVSGFILINSYTLSKRFCIDRERVIADANQYAAAMRPAGILYQVLDASDYTYKKKGLLGNYKRVSLGPNNAWYEYADITKDAYDEEIRLKHKEPEYLFIIGGDEDIPMPLMPHFMSDAPDQDIDTDLLYSYPYGKQMGEKFVKMNIFQYDALFYVGRLPIANDGRYEDIVQYYNRALENGLQVKMDTAYTQCDPHWKAITNEVTRNLFQNDFYPLSKSLPDTTFYNEHIWLTPYVMVDPATRQQNLPAFNEKATYYFFNMHGSAGMNDCGYYGEAMTQREFAEGMAPELMKAATRPNIFFSEACYGGRFIDYPKNNSMLLTAISHQTLAFVGSSRVAFGAVDAQGVHLNNADVMGRIFTDSLLQGMTAGASMMAARMATFKSSPYSPVQMTTIAEFNLYGDPLISMALPNKSKNYSTDKSARPAPTPSQRVASTETLMNKSVGGNTSQSILDQVRSAVDKNIMEISSVIAKQLYEQYNIPAREPSIIQRRTYEDGHKDLNVVFPMEDYGKIVNQAIIVSSENGDIQQVITSK